MNILFSAGYLARYPFANNNIEIALADRLSAMGHNCHVCGFSNDLCGEETRESGVVLSRNNAYPLFERALKKFEHYVTSDTSGSPRAALAKKFAIRHPLSAALVILAHKESFYTKIIPQYGKHIEKYARKHKIDAIVSFCYPFPLAQGLSESKCTLPIIYYQFDPHGLHESLPDETQAERISLECAIMQRAHYTITTQALLNQYQQHPDYQPLCSKMRVLDFPTFAEKKPTGCAPAFTFSKDNINVLYCGTIDDNFRSPAYFLDCCVPLFETMPQLRLYFLGSIMSDTLQRYANKYPTHIIVHSVVESEIANQTIAEADILLNIGNSITNMMPSKIFDYFATGKPIVNVQKIVSCPARPYFEKYPLQITLDESANAAPSEISTLLAPFLQAQKGKQLAFEEVLPLYQTATPEYVACELERMIEEITK